MTRRILKWSIPVDDRDHPIGAGPVVHVACQDHPGKVEVWTDEPDADHLEVTSARVYGTGQPLPDRDEVLGSTVVLNGLVWHVIRVRPHVMPPRRIGDLPHQHDCSLHACWRSTCCTPRRPDCLPETT